MHFMKDIGDVSVFQPRTAEQLTRDAAPFQSNTKETEGMFRIIQRQHRELSLMYIRLQAAEEMNRSLVVVGTAASVALSIVLGICLALMGNSRSAERAATL